MKSRVKGINLLPNEYIQEQKIRNYQILTVWVLLFEVILFVCIVAIPPKFEVITVQEDLDQVTLELTDPKFQGVNQAIKDLETVTVDLENWKNKYKTLKKPNFISARTLDTLTARLPRGVAINTMTLGTAEAEGNSIKIVGSAKSFEQAYNYITTLEMNYTSYYMVHNVEKDDTTGEYKYEVTISVPVAQTEVVEETPVAGEIAEQSQLPIAEQTDGGLE